jgi:CHAD domain-containing protein
MRSPTARIDRPDALLGERVKRVFRELPGALGGEEEAVHQVRVAGRRLRVALPLLARKANDRRLRHALRVLRDLTRTVGAGRDMDVLVALLHDRLSGLKGTSPEHRTLLRRLRAARTRSRRRVAEGILDLDIDGLRGDLRKLLTRGATDVTTVLGRVRRLREEEGAALLRGFSHVGDRYDPVALHALRRRARRLRYAAEVDDAMRGDDSRTPALWKKLQDGIGVLHDHHMLATWLEEQARAAEAAGQAVLVRAARAERRAFIGEGRRLHQALLATRPADLALRALQAMARGRTLA